MRTKATSPVRIEKVKEFSAGVDTANPHHKTNVNVAQGPRTGNTGAHPGKRSAFMASKEERAPLAKVIESAYAKRQHEYEDFEYTNGGSIHDNTYESTKKYGVRSGHATGKKK
jgi:hypothetical protein